MDTGTWILIGVAIYFLPYIVASARERPDSASIGALDFLLGWTFIGWVIALVWALMPIKKPAKEA